MVHYLKMQYDSSVASELSVKFDTTLSKPLVSLSGKAGAQLLAAYTRNIMSCRSLASKQVSIALFIVASYAAHQVPHTIKVSIQR